MPRFQGLVVVPSIKSGSKDESSKNGSNVLKHLTEIWEEQSPILHQRWELTKDREIQDAQEPL